MEVEKESRNCLTINAHQGLYRFNRLIFGVTSAPAIWQRSMDQVLEGMNGTSCILDDMIITGKDDDEHLGNLKEVLKRLKEHGGTRQQIGKLLSQSAKLDWLKITSEKTKIDFFNN